MKHLLIILSILLLSSPVIGQSLKYESVSQCVLQTMEERGLTGNDMFKVVKQECERILGNSFNKEKKGVEGLKYNTKELREIWDACFIQFKKIVPDIPDEVNMDLCDCYSDYMRTEYTLSQVKNFNKEQSRELGKLMKKKCPMPN